jgi:hypothetical protein
LRLRQVTGYNHHLSEERRDQHSRPQSAGPRALLVGAAAGGALISRSGRDRAVLLRAGVAAELLLASAALVIAVVSGARLNAPEHLKPPRRHPGRS